MIGNTEILLNFDGFENWGWEAEFQSALTAHRPDAMSDDVVVGKMRLGILREYADFVREVASQEFRLGLLVEVESLTQNGVVGRVDFANDRRTALAGVERRVLQARGELPDACKDGEPILDRLLSCAEIVFAPDRLDSSLGEFKRECLTRFKNDRCISGYIETANPGGMSIYDLYLGRA